MTNRTTQKTLLNRALPCGALATLLLACTSNATSPTQGTGDGGAEGGGPPNTTAATVPYPVCSPIEPGSYVFNGSGTYPQPATMSCTPAGEPTAGAADTHCAGQTPQPISGASCITHDAGAPSDDGGSSSAEAGAPGPCGENGGDYGTTMYGTEADDDDCKYHVSYSASPICENNGTYFVVTASYLSRTGLDGGLAPLTSADAYAELCLSNTHVGPQADGRPPSGNQEVVEGPPGTYTIGPVVFDAPGDWTVRFHFNEFCCDVAPDSPHGHAAFHVTVP